MGKKNIKPSPIEPKDVEIKPKKLSDFKVRIISAVVLLLLLGVYLGLAIIYTESTWPAKEVAGWFNYVITLVLIGLAMYELLSLFDIGGKDSWYLMALGIFLGEILFIFPMEGKSNQPLYWYLNLTLWLKWYVVFIFVLVVGISLFLIGYFSKNPMTGFYLLLYTILIALGFKGFSIIALALDNPFGFNTIIFAWGAIILTDSFAYFGGRKFGKTKMAPAVSPKKTWEGAGIGTGVAVIVATIYGCLFYYLLPYFAPFKPMLIPISQQWDGLPGLMLFFLAVLISITGQLGDLAFSYIKRLYNKKDFSNLIPGHGGILDRFDSFLVVFTILYFIILSVGTGVN